MCLSDRVSISLCFLSISSLQRMESAAKNPRVWLFFVKVQKSTAPATKNDGSTSKSAPERGVL